MPRRRGPSSRELTGTNMEIWTAVYEFPVGYTIPVHSHKGEEVVYVLEGAKLKRPDGTEVELKRCPAGPCTWRRHRPGSRLAETFCRACHR